MEKIDININVDSIIITLITQEIKILLELQNQEKKNSNIYNILTLLDIDTENKWLIIRTI